MCWDNLPKLIKTLHHQNRFFTFLIRTISTVYREDETTNDLELISFDREEYFR